MSKLKIRLFGLALVLISAAGFGGAGLSASDCIDVVVWAINQTTGECRQFPNPCSVPPGWKIYYQNVCTTS